MVKYITAADVGRILSCTPSAARGWLERNNVPAISLGAGRGLGLRWNELLVQVAIDKSTVISPHEIEEKKKEAKKVRLNSKRPLVGRSLSEQLALLRAGVVQ